MENFGQLTIQGATSHLFDSGRGCNKVHQHSLATVRAGGNALVTSTYNLNGRLHRGLQDPDQIVPLNTLAANTTFSAAREVELNGGIRPEIFGSLASVLGSRGEDLEKLRMLGSNREQVVEVLSNWYFPQIVTLIRSGIKNILLEAAPTGVEAIAAARAINKAIKWIKNNGDRIIRFATFVPSFAVTRNKDLDPLSHGLGFDNLDNAIGEEFRDFEPPNIIISLNCIRPSEIKVLAEQYPLIKGAYPNGLDLPSDQMARFEKLVVAENNDEELSESERRELKELKTNIISPEKFYEFADWAYNERGLVLAGGCCWTDIETTRVIANARRKSIHTESSPHLPVQNIVGASTNY